MTSIGIIGTGEIGSRMCRLLAARGHGVACYDIRPEALVRPRADGIRIAASIAELAGPADLLITCVTDGAALRSVVSGDGGLLQSLSPGKTVIDTTSAEPWITMELARELAANGIDFLDAPVSGGVPAAEAGRMNFIVGGDVTVLARWRDVLLCMGPVITHVGAAGAGHSAKAVNMLCLAATMFATAEVLGIGCAAGARFAQLVEAIEAGPAANYSTRVHFPRFIVPGNYDSGFSFDLMLKDLSIGIGLVDRTGASAFLGKSIFEVYKSAAAGLRGQDNTNIVDLVHDFRRCRGTTPLAPDMLASLGALGEAANTVIAAEAVGLAVASGIEARTILDVIGASSGDSKALKARVAMRLHGDGAASDNSLAGLRSSVALALAAASWSGVPTLLSGQAIALHGIAGRSGGERNAVIDLLARSGPVQSNPLQGSLL